MAFLKFAAEPEAAGALKRLYDAARSRAGYVANIIKVMLHPSRRRRSGSRSRRLDEALADRVATEEGK